MGQSCISLKRFDVMTSSILLVYPYYLIVKMCVCLFVCNHFFENPPWTSGGLMFIWIVHGHKGGSSGVSMDIQGGHLGFPWTYRGVIWGVSMDIHGGHLGCSWTYRGVIWDVHGQTEGYLGCQGEGAKGPTNEWPKGPTAFRRN